MAQGKTKCLVIGHIPPSALHRRIDFLYTPPEQYAFAILYFTGSKHFNTAMRGLALKNGLSLNEHAFTVVKTGKPLSSIDPNASFKTELDIFNYLDMEYREPTERINDKSVVDKSKKTSIAHTKSGITAAKSFAKHYKLSQSRKSVSRSAR